MLSLSLRNPVSCPHQIVDIFTAVSPGGVDLPDVVSMMRSHCVCCSCFSVCPLSILSLEIGKSYQLCMARSVLVLDGMNLDSIAVSNMSIFVVLRNILIGCPDV